MMTVSTTERAFPVKFIKKGVDEEVILSYAIGPLIKGKRAPSILRMKLKPGHVLQIENLSKGVWIPIAHASDGGLHAPIRASSASKTLGRQPASTPDPQATTASGSHSVAADPYQNQVYVPIVTSQVAVPAGQNPKNGLRLPFSRERMAAYQASVFVSSRVCMMHTGRIFLTYIRV
jgi:hypothetical protein